MAAWQADFTLQPEFMALPANYRGRLDALLPRSQGWAAEMEAWGDEDGNRIAVWHDPRGAVEITVRIDVRSLDAGWLERLLEFVLVTRRVLQTPDGRDVDSSLGSLMLVLRGSPAWRFVEDPEAYLRRVSLGDYRDG